jgi:peroxiredoxin Q/BCP
MQRRISIAAFVLAASASLSSGLSMQQNNNNNAKSPSSRRSFVETGAVAAFGIAALAGTPGKALAANDSANGVPSRGAKAPNFELPNSRGSGLITLDELVKNSKWTVLYFYPGAFTSGCTLEARGFQRDLDSYRKLNAQIVGVSVDPVEKNAQFCTEEKLDFFMLSDKGGQVSKAYGSALSIPGFGTFSNRQTYIIDPKGELRWIFTDVESRISRHSSEVLEKLNELETA